MLSAPTARPVLASHTRRLVLAAALALASALPADAQSPYDATLAVTVTGESGPLESASVLLYLGPKLVRQGSTDAGGVARFAGIAPDEYQLLVSRIGYRDHRVYSLALTRRESRSLAVRLDLVPVALKSLEATATGVNVDPRSAAVATDIPKAAVQLMPLAHEAREVVGLTPGARPEQVWGGANIQANNYQLDGLSANHPGLGGDLVQPSLNWIERIEIKGLGAGAEYGNFQGGLVNIVTRSGGNDRRASFRSTFETHALNGSNLVATEIGSEVSTRYDLSGDVGGPIVRDRFFYFAAADLIRNDARFLNHLREPGPYVPSPEAQRQTKLFGKLTWKPGGHDVLEATGGRIDDRTERYGLTGYEAPDASWRYTAPSSFANLSWTRLWARWATTEAKINRLARDERQLPYNGHDVPATQFYTLRPPTLTYNNAPITLTHRPASASGSLALSLAGRIAGAEQTLKLGVEDSWGRFDDRRTRNGGMTWRPTRRRSVDPADASTWPFPTSPFIPVTWGGEVDLSARVENAAAYAQAGLSLGKRLVLTPGLRWGRWSGWLLPHGDESARFLALHDRGWDPRMGIIANPLGDASVLLKGHWGRYHQSMVAQFFDRVAGGDVFTNEQLWFYWGPQFTDPATRFTAAQRDSLRATNVFTKEAEVVLDETGKVGSYRQPYVDQWVLSVERNFGTTARMKAVYVARRNHDMVALVDVNRARNYTVFNDVFVLDASGQRIEFEGGNIFLKKVYIPNFLLKERLRCLPVADCPDGLPVPGMTPADIGKVSYWNPQYELTNAPDARREFDELQLVFELSRPAWGANVSWVLTRLKGNLDNVSGYEDPAEYGAGPYVRVNEGVNAYGYLPNFSGSELKVSVWGVLPWKVQGGLYYTEATGEHYSPRFTMSGIGLYRYQLGANRQELDYRFFWPMEGHNQFVGPRGKPTVDGRVRLDVHVEREVPGPARHARATIDVFNLLNSNAITAVNPSVNNGRNFYYFLPSAPGSTPLDPNQFYNSVLGRIQPRTVRLGLRLEL